MNIRKRETMIILLVTAILLGIFAFTDLAISQAVYNPESLYGYLLQVVGELPSSITAVFGAMILLLFMDTRVMWLRIVKTIGLCIVILMASSMGCMLSITYAGIENIPLVLFCMVLMVVLAYFFTTLIPMHKREQAKKIACMGLWLFLFSMVSFNLIKMTWGRMRFVYMEDPIAQFTPWFQRIGFTSDNTFMSFPSGHGAQASFILMITLLPLVFSGLKKYRSVLCIIVFTWILLVCSSRVILGMHFSSDVTMGFLVTFALFMILKTIYLKPRIPELQDED